MLIHKREICQKFKELSDWCRKLSGLIILGPVFEKKKKKKRFFRPQFRAPDIPIPPKKLSVPRRDMNLMNWFPNVLKILVLCFCLFVCLCVFCCCFCFVFVYVFVFWNARPRPCETGGRYRGSVKLDSMWQHRLTRPLHVQHTYMYYCIIYKQNPFNIISRGVQRWTSTDFRLK